MILSQGETIVDEKKFLESHVLRLEQSGRLAEPFKERLELYYKLKANESNTERNTAN